MNPVQMDVDKSLRQRSGYGHDRELHGMIDTIQAGFRRHLPDSH